ncbi:MAG TPA: hypothetical protein VGG34_10335 [Opitutaceae bacterium]|jgi:hypothetical protein
MKNKQVRNLVILLVLTGLTLVSWRINRLPAQRLAAAQLAAKSQGQQENPLQARFKKIRGEMDALYHYRSKPTLFDTAPNPFRLPAGMGVSEIPVAADAPSKSSTPAQADIPLVGPALLSRAIANIRFGGVVTMNDTIQLTVDGQLHKRGDVFTSRLGRRLVLIRIRELTPSFVTLSLDDPDAGVAVMKVRIN